MTTGKAFTSTSGIPDIILAFFGGGSSPNFILCLEPLFPRATEMLSCATSDGSLSRCMAACCVMTIGAESRSSLALVRRVGGAGTISGVT